MPLLNYQKQFADLVEKKIKKQTIRARRKRPIEAGDRLYHYTGLRTKACRKLLESICISTEEIMIDKTDRVFINGRLLYDKESFAFNDGFRPFGQAWRKMIKFFKKVHGLPFNGQIIHW